MTRYWGVWVRRSSHAPRQDPEDGIAPPPLRRPLFVTPEVDGVRTRKSPYDRLSRHGARLPRCILQAAACLRLFGFAGLSGGGSFAEAERAPGPGWVWTSFGSSGSPHSEHVITGSNVFPHLRCSCSSGRPRSSTMWVSPQCTSAIMTGYRSRPFWVRMYSCRLGDS